MEAKEEEVLSRHQSSDDGFKLADPKRDPSVKSEQEVEVPMDEPEVEEAVAE